MVNLDSRRGAVHHSNHDGCIARTIQVFFLITTAVIIGGYYVFLTATISAKDGTGGNVIQGRGMRGNDGNDYQSKATIGYAVTVSGCPKAGSRGDFGAGISDGAAVLQHSIHLNSIRNPARDGRYDYKMYALVHPEAESCARPALEPLGYELLLRDVPVPVSEIEGDFLREKVAENGCCGEKEFVKLHAYTLVQHPIVVHLDLDTLILKPMDRLYDAMLDGPPRDGTDGGIDVAFGDPLVPPTAEPDSVINAFFTRDYNMAHAGQKHNGAQGGFLVLRPSLKVYKEFEAIIRKGDFQKKKGWGGLGFGPFYGSMTFQGIIPYFYDHLHPGTGVELNHCVYNNMADNPRDKATKNDIVNGRCRDGYNRPDKNDQCEDCRSRPFEDVYTTHFTLCQKPWECLPQDGDRIQERLCRKFHAEWYRVREDLETNIWGRKEVTISKDISPEDATIKMLFASTRGGSFQIEHFRGYCKSRGGKGYIKLVLPTIS